MTGPEKLIWAAAYVHGGCSLLRADEAVQRFRTDVRSLQNADPDRWSIYSEFALEFNADERPKRIECPNCRGASVVDGKCVGCGAEVPCC